MTGTTNNDSTGSTSEVLLVIPSSQNVPCYKKCFTKISCVFIKDLLPLLIPILFIVILFILILYMFRFVKD
jgi:hypothetical protein